MELSDQMRLVVVIINYKTPDLVIGALGSLESEIHYEKDKVVVVDNASNDGSLDKISAYIKKRKWTDWIDIIASPVNGGFSAGNNLGFEHMQAKYYLLLNGDAWVHPKSISTMIKTMEKEKYLGLVGPRIEWEDGTQQVSCFHNVTPSASFLNAARTGVFTRLAGLLGVKEVAIPVEDKYEQPDWLSFACVLLKYEMVKDVGLMDEGYFMYYEDNDYCRRALDSGWQLIFDNGARVVHLNKGDSNQNGIKRLPHYYYRSRSRYFLKFYGRFGLLRANTFWFLGRCVSLLRELFERKQAAFHSMMWWDIWIGFWDDYDKYRK